MTERTNQRRWVRAAVPWMLVLVIGGIVAAWMYRHLNETRAGEAVVWRHPGALALLGAALVVGVIGFHLHRRRSAVMGFSQTRIIGRVGPAAWFSDVPVVLRVIGVAALAVALARPETYRIVKHEEDSVDIMIVFDMSKSMEESDMPRDRMDAAQRVVRRFLRRTKSDRVGLVVFGQRAMLQCPLTQDMTVLETVVKDLQIGDVPELGTAIGDGLALALAQLRRSDGTCDPTPGAEQTCPEGFACTADGKCSGKKNKVVILLSDGDSNSVTQFEPDEAAEQARKMNVKVYTVLVGREGNDLFGGGMTVNPETLRSIANITGGEFFRATDYESFDRGFQAVRSSLDKTKRVRRERIPDKQLFVPLAVLAMLLLASDLLLSHTRLRRLP
ncbi:MAG: VWA domain-containing protein [Kofleriaceae bacterium]